MKRLFYFLSYIYTWPLYVYFKVALKFQNNQALYFKSDLSKRKEKFFELMFYQTMYRNLFYKRFKPYAAPLKIICPPEDSFSIDGNVSIGEGLFLMHPYRTIVHAKSIGNNVSLFHNITIGANVGTDKLPIIGNNVTIFTGAVVVGGVIIGDNSIIGANSVITKDVPANCTVVGNPAYIIKNNGKCCNIKL